METFRRVQEVVYISSSILITLTNLVVIFLVIFSPRLRRRCPNLMMVSMGLADLLMGCFDLPMVATTLSTGYLADCHAHSTIQVIGDHGVFFIVGWELVTFNLLHLLDSGAGIQRKCPSAVLPGYLKTGLLTTWPWLVVLCVLLPVIGSNSNLQVLALSGDIMCIMNLPRSELAAVCILTLYLPFYICVIALLVVVLLYSKRYPRDLSPALMVESTATEVVDEVGVPLPEPPRSSPSPLPVIAPTAVYLVCYMPLIVHTWLHFSQTSTPVSLYGMTMFGMMLRSIALPVSWLVFRDIRQEMKDSIWRLKLFFLGRCSGCCVGSIAAHQPPTTSSTVFFSRLQDAQPT